MNLSDKTLQQTVLHGAHERVGGRMVPFAGFSMPIQYESILAEVRAVRHNHGMFDVSHMARFFIDGSDARSLLDWVHSADIGESMPVGQARYGLICNREGGIIDDGIVYRLSADGFLLIANASNGNAVYDWLKEWSKICFGDLVLRNETPNVAMIAVQGPFARSLVDQMCEEETASMRPFRVMKATIEGLPVLLARTGYTGEDGFELMPSSDGAEAIWSMLLERGVTPCGLGARDILRLEAGLLLHGSDMDQSVTPLDAGLKRFVKTNRDFCGSSSIHLIESNKAIVGLKCSGRGSIPRSHTRILDRGLEIGAVTSGAYSPTLDTNIALGYVPKEHAEVGNTLEMDVRGKKLEASIVRLPFYSRR